MRNKPAQLNMRLPDAAVAPAHRVLGSGVCITAHPGHMKLYDMCIIKAVSPAAWMNGQACMVAQLIFLYEVAHGWPWPGMPKASCLSGTCSSAGQSLRDGVRSCTCACRPPFRVCTL